MSERKTTKFLFPRFKLSKLKKNRFWLLEDLVNNSPKFLLMKSDLMDLRGQINHLFNSVLKGGE